MQHDLSEWVQNPESLTKRLSDYTCHKIRFVLNKQGWIDENTWRREISWKYGNEIWVLAKTFIPKETIGMFANTLLKNPKQPIGEILFSDKLWVRGPIQVRQINADDDYYHWVKTYVANLPEQLTMRQSDFSVGAKKLTVVEIFMPDFLNVI